jgi:hypothetical protein
VTPIPDWLVERAALDEVGPHRDRIARADPRELAEQIAALRTDNAAELAAHPAAPAVAQIEARIAGEHRRRATRRRRWQIGMLGFATAASIVLIVGLAGRRPVTENTPAVGSDDGPPTERVKGAVRLLAFRLAGNAVEQLGQDALVRVGDVIQLRYNAGGHTHGVIASVDGAGAVTLHHPASEDGPTALAPKTTALPHAYALDDAPQFERFFFVTADEPIDVGACLASLRALARRSDGATASLELPAKLGQWSLRLRKPGRPSTHHKSP